MFSTEEDVQYCGGCSVYGRISLVINGISSVLVRKLNMVEDIIGTLKDV